MTDTTTNVQGDQTPSVTSAAGTVPAVPMVEKSRLDGALQKIQELTLANKALADENTSLKASAGDLQAKLASAASEMQAKTGEFDKKLAEYTSKETEYSEKLKAKDTLERKLKAIKTLNVPSLISIIDSLPSAETDEAQVEAIKSIAEFAKQQAQERESQLTAGVTKTVVTPASGGEMPTTEEGWKKAIEAAPLGSQKRQDLMDAWFASMKT